MTPEKRTEKIMKKINVSRQDLSDALGISLSSVAMYYTGHHKIRKVVALGIQACYGINADWILNGRTPVFVKQGAGHLSSEAMEIAVMYNSLPRKLQPTAMTLFLGLQKLKDEPVVSVPGGSKRRAA